jgi:hypothetical protein
MVLRRPRHRRLSGKRLSGCRGKFTIAWRSRSGLRSAGQQHARKRGLEGLRMRARAQRLGAVAALSALVGCSSIGPAVIRRDRTDYSGAMASSWKEMQLLNIVKFRYFDPPIFVDVPSVVSQQELYGQATFEAQVVPNPLTTSTRDFYRPQLQSHYTDRPTISYTPITGLQFVNLLLRPIPPATIFSLIDSGHPADFLLRLTVNSINGLSNYSLAPARGHAEDQRFRRLLAALRRLQQAGAIAARTVQVPNKPSTTAVRTENPPSTTTSRTRTQPSTTQTRGETRASTTVFFRRHAGPAVERDIRLVKSLLGLDPRRDAFMLTGEPRHTPEEIAVQSRSMQEILSELAAGVDVPTQDVVEGRATLIPNIGEGPDTTPLIHIHSGPEPPNDAYTAVRYRDRWFWVDDNDLFSKRDFMFLLIFYALSETRAIPQAPVVTISASGR